MREIVGEEKESFGDAAEKATVFWGIFGVMTAAVI